MGSHIRDKPAVLPRVDEVRTTPRELTACDVARHHKREQSVWFDQVRVRREVYRIGTARHTDPDGPLLDIAL